jgi:hypothetical protein
VKAHRVVRRRGSHIFLNSRLTDGGEVVSLSRRPPFTAGGIPGTHFCYRPSRPQGHSAAGRITVNYSLSLVHTLYTSLQHALSLLSVLCLHGLSHGNGSQRRRFLIFQIPRLLSLLAVASLTTNSSWPQPPTMNLKIPGAKMYGVFSINGCGTG